MKIKTKTKDKILCESLRLFARKGYEAVSVAEIAEAVGIKAPSLYKHFKSKREIFDEIIGKVNEADKEKAKENKMPEETAAECAESYKNVSDDLIKEYTKTMFLHWTEEEFFGNFRRMLTLEQYKSKEMVDLYQNYIAGGPVQYLADVFEDKSDSKEEAYEKALEFYGVMYLLYSLYDAGYEVHVLLNLLEKHIEKF